MNSYGSSGSLVSVIFGLAAFGGLIMAVICWQARRAARNSGQLQTKGRRFLLWWGFFGGMSGVLFGSFFWMGEFPGIDNLYAAAMVAFVVSPFGALMMQWSLKLWGGILKSFLPGLFKGSGAGKDTPQPEKKAGARTRKGNFNFTLNDGFLGGRKITEDGLWKDEGNKVIGRFDPDGVLRKHGEDLLGSLVVGHEGTGAELGRID